MKKLLTIILILLATFSVAEAKKPVKKTVKKVTKTIFAQSIATSTVQFATTTSSISTSTATTTPVIIKWNFDKIMWGTEYSDLQNVRLLFFPEWSDTHTLAQVTRCEMTTNAEEGIRVIDYDNSGQINFKAVLSKDHKYTSQVRCVAFRFENGKYTEYYSPIVDIK